MAPHWGVPQSNGKPPPAFVGATQSQCRSLKATTPWHFVVWWNALLCLHLVCIGYYVGFASVYRHLLHSFVSFQLRTNSIGIAESEYVKVAIIHEVVAAVHALFVLMMIGGSLRERRLVFTPNLRHMSGKIKAQIAVAQRRARTGPHTPIVPAGALSDVSTNRTSSITLASQFVYGASSRAGSAVFGRHGILGVEYVYFDHMLLARELVEVSLQTYQAYRMTRLLTRLWLVRVYVVLLIANCWVVTLLHRVYVRRHRLRRMMALLCDAVLDVVSSIGISFVIFCSYVPQYTDHLGFPFGNWYNDEWFVGTVQEFQIMMVVSWGDMASRLVFAVGVLQAMDSLKDMLTYAVVEPTPSSVNPAREGPDTQVFSLPPNTTSADKTTRSATTTLSWRQRVLHALVHTVGPTLFVVWGTVILVIHIYAEAQRSDLPCKLPLRPWLSSEPACSLVEIDCYTRSVSGTSESFQAQWTIFDPAFTAGLFIRHCPELVIPSSMALYTGITSMKVYNATITSWPSASGLASASHERLRAMYLIRTNFSGGELPAGLVRSDFPQTFRSLYVSKSNLASLPEHADHSWPKGMSISIEHAAFTSFPDVLIRLSPGLISVSHCPISRLPAALFELPTLVDLFIIDTAIQELPRDVRKPTNLNLLFLGGSNVSVFWPWVDSIIDQSLLLHKPFYLNAQNTPFCEELEQIRNGTRQQFSAAASFNGSALPSLMDVSTPSRLARTESAVGCVGGFDGLFPLVIQDMMSAINRADVLM